MVKHRKSTGRQGDLFDFTPRLRTAICVDALRESVRTWRSRDYPGTTATTKTLLAHWFLRDHRTRSGTDFEYHRAQRDAIETLIYVWECERIRSRGDLIERFASDSCPPWSNDTFARLCVKMATGSGKTKVMALAIAWQFLNARCEPESIATDYATTFLILSPNLIVNDRLQADFGKGQIFDADPVIPTEMRSVWNFSYVTIGGGGDTPDPDGVVLLSNVQQLHPRRAHPLREPSALTAVVGSTLQVGERSVGVAERIGRRVGRMMVLNDEAHHTHSETSAWTSAILRLGAKTPVSVQLDLSATPRFPDGTLFPWIISDYPLKQAIVDGIVKRPMRGETRFEEVASERASQRYEGFLVAGVERWREYTNQLAATRKKPVLFVMLSNTKEADDVADWLRKRYPNDLGGERTLVIHTDREGDVSEKDLQKARELARNVDTDENVVRAIVSVLMLREGWDVQNVTVVVGLRPFTATANILPEQAIGRGLRLMFRGQARSTYEERVDIIGNEKFLEFVDSLENLEEVRFDRFELSSSPLEIITIRPLPERAAHDILIPQLSPSLVRRKSVAQQITDLNARQLPHSAVPLPSGVTQRTVKYEGYDIVTDEKELERIYAMPTVRTSQELVSFYARRIGETLRLPGQFASLSIKVKDFLRFRFFEQEVDLDDEAVLGAVSTPAAHQLTLKAFRSALGSLVLEEVVPVQSGPHLSLLSCEPFPWSHGVRHSERTVFNLTPCESSVDQEFAAFLDSASDVSRFARLLPNAGFAIEYTDGQGSLRLFYPPWIAQTADGTRHVIAIGNAKDDASVYRDRAALLWCGNAEHFDGHAWRYERVSRDLLKGHVPPSFAALRDLLQPLQLQLLDSSISARALARQLYSRETNVLLIAKQALEIFRAAHIADATRWLELELSGYDRPGSVNEILGVSTESRLVQQILSYRAHSGERIDGKGVNAHFFVETLEELVAASDAASAKGTPKRLTLRFGDGSPAAYFAGDVFDRVLLGLRATLKQQLERVAE